MNKQLIFLLFAVCMVSTIYATSILNVCKRTGHKGALNYCIGVSGGCTNLIGGPFVSGFTTGASYTCKVYSNTGCGGSMKTIGHSGANYGFQGKSYRC